MEGPSVFVFLFVYVLSLNWFSVEATCGYSSCPKTKSGYINVHLVPHSHDDVGWLKTVDQYYYGDKNKIQLGAVQYTLDLVVEELKKSPDRRFIYVETAFFWRWWTNQDDEMKSDVKRLVNNGQLEFILGGWVMNDEACSHYNAIVDQMTLGLRFLNETFGECGLPKVAWQIDPFGHSREQASLFAQMGYDGLFFGRLDYQDKDFRKQNHDMEMIWSGSPNNLGNSSWLFTGVLFNGYNPPDGYCFDIFCEDDPINDDPKLLGYNLEEKVNNFIEIAKEWAEPYDTGHALMTMGSDFQYMASHTWYKNLDKLIKYVNRKQITNSSRVNLLYSTPSCYLQEVHKAKKPLSVKTDDFFPYASDPHAFWTGYFTSRPTFKYFIQRANNFLQVCKQLAVGAFNGQPKQGLLDKVWTFSEPVTIAQHHDAVSGTAKQHVTDDYSLRLSIGLKGCEDVVDEAFRKLLQNKKRFDDSSNEVPRGISGRPPTYEFCHLLNISSCAPSESMSDFVVSVYNPLARDLHDTYIRIPVSTPLWDVKGNKGLIQSQITNIPQPVLGIPGRRSKALYELVFPVDVLPALSISNFQITKNTTEDVHLFKLKSQLKAIKKGGESFRSSTLKQSETFREDFMIKNSKGLAVVFDSISGLLKSVIKGNVEVPINQNFYYYLGMSGDNSKFEKRASGAYIFRPNTTKSGGGQPLPITERVFSYQVYKGDHVSEVHQVFTEWISQVIRLYDKADMVEFEWLIGPVSVEDNYGKEIVTRYSSDIRTNGVFFTDANGRQLVRRKRDVRETWPYKKHENVSGNYYPVNSRILISRNEYLSQNGQTLVILNDRSQGGSSMNDGEIELMLHRRLLFDDAFGVGEPLNETAFGTGLVARGKHWLLLAGDGTDVPIARHREAAQEIFMDKVLGFADVSLLERPEYSFMRNSVSTNNLDLSPRNSVAMRTFVSFPTSPKSIVKRDDGSVSYMVKCPFLPCRREYILTYKRYSSYYVHKKGNKRNRKSSNVRPPKWNYGQIKKHFKQDHSNSNIRQTSLWRYFRPSDDGVVIEHGIRENILRDKLSHYPMLFGVTRAEILPSLGEHDAVYGLETEKRREVLKQLVDGFYSHRGEILAAAIHEYTDWERPVQHPISVRDETLDALADAQRLGGVPGEDLMYVFGVPLFISGNEFVFSSSTGGNIGEQNWNNKLKTSVGSSVSASEPEHFKFGLYIGNFTRNEVQLSLTLVHYWANFIRTGNPNAESPEGSPHGFGASGSKGGSSEAGTSGGNSDSPGGGGGGGTGTSLNNVNAGGNRYPQSPQLQVTTLQQQYQHSSQDKFTKPKLIEWPPYDTLFKKYLSIDAKPRVRNHYRAHKLSFWLNLVPELMRNGYYNNGSPLGSTGFQSRSNNNNHNSPFNNGSYTTPHSPTIELVGPWESMGKYYVESNSSYPGDISGPLQYPPGRHPHYHGHHHEGEGYQIYSTALSVTIAVGCSLLILNILVFAAFYYYRDKRRNRDSRGRGIRREGESNYGHHQQTPLTTLSNTGGTSADNPGTAGGGGPEGSLSPMDLQMHEMPGASVVSVSATSSLPTSGGSVVMGQTHHQHHHPAFSETSNLSGGARQLLSTPFHDNSSSSLHNTPIRFPSHHQQQQQQQLKENGQILNLRHHLQQQQQQQQHPQAQMPLLPMPNICGDLNNVPNLQQLLHSAAQQDAANRLSQGMQSQQQQQHHPSQHQQYFHAHHQQQLQGQQNLNSSTLSNQMPRKHQKGTSNMNLTNLDFSMPDAILAAAMMLNYRQQPSSSSSASTSDQMIPGTLLRSSQKSGSASAPRKSALNMKEQLLISAGIIGSSGGATSGSNVIGSLGRTGGVGISSSASSSLHGGFGGGITTTASKQPGTSLISGPNISVSSTGVGSVSSAPSAGVANVIQFDMENSASTGGGGSCNASGKTVPRPPKRHTPTVKFSPDTFANNSSSGGNGSPELQMQSTGNSGVGATSSATFSGGGNVTLSSVATTGSPNSAHIPTTANTNVTTINQSSAPGGQTLKSSLKKNSSYSNSSPGMSEELKV